MRFSIRALLSRSPRAPSFTKERLLLEHPDIAASLRADGARAECARIHGVYTAGSYVTLHPLIERLMFDGRTPSEAAAMAAVALVQAEALIASEALRQVSEGEAIRRH